MSLNEKEQKHFDAWKDERMAIIADSFKSIIEKLDTAPPLKAFSYMVSRYAEETFKEFAKKLGLDDAQKIPAQFLTCIYAAFIGGFNSVLPRDYQHIVVCIFSEISQTIRIGSAERKAVIPGTHDMISTRIVPIIRVKNKIPEGNVAIKNFMVTDVNFGNADDLERFV